MIMSSLSSFELNHSKISGIDPDQEPLFIKPKHECGVFGIFGHPNAAELTYYGLYALQHRGQESAGIVSAKGGGSEFQVHRGMGLVSQVFSEENLRALSGTRAIGHVRYSTTGCSNLKNAQPLMVDCACGQIAVAHNGNLINAQMLRQKLEANGSIFQTTSDTETILHLMAQPDERGRENQLIRALTTIQGAYSLVMLSENEMIGARDPHGFRPLSIGKLGGSYVLSSETSAFDLIHATFVRDVEPGEIVVIDESGLRSIKPFADINRKAFCIFEYVYFARPDSNLNQVNVGGARIRMGQQLAREHPVEADLVLPVPDSGSYAALGFSEEAKIPYSNAFVRNHYIGRTFLQPTQLIRDFHVRVKLNLIREMVRGKRVVVVDDSVVRGTTARARVRNLREAGAKEVHIRISCPPHRYPCYYGIDFPDPKDLLANQMNPHEITQYLGADSIGYLSPEGMVAACGLDASTFCMACFNGDYPTPAPQITSKFYLGGRQERQERLEPLISEMQEIQKMLL